jgi:hypothetical protein
MVRGPLQARPPNGYRETISQHGKQAKFTTENLHAEYRWSNDLRIQKFELRKGEEHKISISCVVFFVLPDEFVWTRSIEKKTQVFDLWAGRLQLLEKWLNVLNLVLVEHQRVEFRKRGKLNIITFELNTKE